MPRTVKTPIGARELKALRLQYGYTQAEMAEFISTSRSNYNRKENGKVPIYADEFLKGIKELERRGPKHRSKTNLIYEVLKKVKI